MFFLQRKPSSLVPVAHNERFSGANSSRLGKKQKQKKNERPYVHTARELTRFEVHLLCVME